MDEADRLLDMGFSDIINKLLRMLPRQRQTGLFSATMTDSLSELVRTGMRSPVKIVANVQSETVEDERRTPTGLQVRYLRVKDEQKIPRLVNILGNGIKEYPKTIIFFASGAAADYFTQHLRQLLPDHEVIDLYGKQSDKVRKRNFAKFVQCQTPCTLLTTDLAARGLDLPDIDLIVQVDPPTDPKVFSHRCGRAGRAGRQGKAIVMLCHGREEDFVELLKVRKVPIEEEIIEQSDSQVNEILEKMKEENLKDRGQHDKGVLAYVSHIQAYTKHIAKFIFRIQDLDYGSLGREFALLRLPKMPELRDATHDFVATEVDWDNFAYLNEMSEQKRLKEKAERDEFFKNNPKVERPKNYIPESVPFSKQKMRKLNKMDKKSAQLKDAKIVKLDEEKTDTDEENETDWKELVRERKRQKQKSFKF